MGHAIVSNDLVALLLDASVKAGLLGLAADAILRALRVKDAALSHSVWVSVAAGMLLFPAMRTYLPEINVPLIPTAVDADSAYHFAGEAFAPTLLAFYLGGVLALGVRLLVGLGVARRLIRDGRPIEDERLDRIICDALPSRSWRRAPEILESDRVRVPVTLGAFRSYVLLPPCWRSWSPDKLESVLAHECAHVRRGDFVWQLVAETNLCVFWFHPVAWLLRRRLSLAAERACDDSAILVVGDHRTYARHLVDIAGELCGHTGRVAVGLPMAHAGQVATRLDAILDRERSLSGRLRRGGAVLVALLASSAWVIAAVVCWQAYTCPIARAEAMGECPVAAAVATVTDCTQE